MIPVTKKENRSKFLLKIDEEQSYCDKEKFKVANREGWFVEKYDIISKYERCKKSLKGISFSQYAKMYTPTWKEKGLSEEEKLTCENDLESECFEENDKFDYIMTCRGDDP